MLLNTHIIDQARWEQEQRFCGTLWREVMRDGVLLTPQGAAVSWDLSTDRLL